MANKDETDKHPEPTPSWGGVPMEKTGPDWTKVSSKRLQELLKPDGGRGEVIDRDTHKPTNYKR